MAQRLSRPDTNDTGSRWHSAATALLVRHAPGGGAECSRVPGWVTFGRRAGRSSQGGQRQLGGAAGEVLPVGDRQEVGAQQERLLEALLTLASSEAGLSQGGLHIEVSSPASDCPPPHR